VDAQPQSRQTKVPRGLARATREIAATLAGLVWSVVAHAQPAVGIVAVDVQKLFVSEAVNPNIGAIIHNIQSTFKLADQNNLPFFITFEATTKGDRSLASGLTLPHHQQTIIKTKYAATGLPSFAAMLRDWRVTNLIVLGSETDVCVLQTVLGLRVMGFQVALQSDGVFSSEPNVAPAVQRMTDAGVQLVDVVQIKSWIAKGSPLADSAVTTFPASSPVLQAVQNGAFSAALVLNRLDDEHLNDPGDPQMRAKLARLRELLLMAEWTQIPTYLVGADPARFQWPTALSQALGARALDAIKRRSWHPYADLRSQDYAQIVVAGSHDQAETIYRDFESRQIFAMKDSLIGRAPSASGAIPFTFKMFYYEMTTSVNASEWPSQDWVRDSPRFVPLMRPPQSLPPVQTP
jgi:nicotinamidase-related amidase